MLSLEIFAKNCYVQFSSILGILSDSDSKNKCVGFFVCVFAVNRFWHSSTLIETTTLADVMGTEIVEYRMRSRLECASLCATHFTCSAVNMVKSMEAAGVICQLIMNGGLGQTGNITGDGTVYNIDRN